MHVVMPKPLSTDFWVHMRARTRPWSVWRADGRARHCLIGTQMQCSAHRIVYRFVTVWDLLHVAFVVQLCQSDCVAAWL